MMNKNNKSNQICCVVNCNNTYANTTNVISYNFPNRAYQKELKSKWVKAVNRFEYVFIYLNKHCKLYNYM